MISNLDDKTLAQRILEGDSEAENYLFNRFKERIKFLVRIRLKIKVSDFDQEDIFSDIQHAVLINLRKGAYDPERGKPLEAYIAGIAINIVGQYFRKLNNKKTSNTIDGLHQIPSNENILTDLIDEEQKEKLKACLEKLKFKYRQVLILRFYENKTIDELSEYLNIEKRRVSERINYAVKLILKECKKHDFFQ